MSGLTPRTIVAAASLVATYLCGAAAWAASPQLSAILPPGVQRTGERVLTFTGARLGDVEEVLLYDGGVTVSKLEKVDPQNVRVTVAVADDCRLGEHLAQLRTRTGISDYRSFFIGALPTVDEQEPNSEFDAPQRIETNVTVAGVLQNEDADYYRISCKKGERISVEVEGIRLGQAFFDPFLSIADSKRFELSSCDDTALAKQDGYLSVVIPEDGEYTVLLRESSYRGADNCRYRLHVGNFPRPTVAYPAGAQRGEQVKVQLLGDAGGPMEQTVTAPTDADARQEIFAQDDRGISPSPVPFRAFNAGNILEAEPNDAFETATTAELPLALNGRMDQSGDVDVFKFAAKKDQVWEIECYGRRIGSPVDTVMELFNAEKAQIAANDDARGQDSYFRWQAPADGEYFLRVRDHLGQAGETYVYRVELTPVTPSLKLGIPRVDRYSQTRQSIVVPRGNRYGALILGTRMDFGGPVELEGDEILPGVKRDARQMHPSLNLMPVVFEAAEDVPVEGALVDLRGKLVDPNQTVLEGRFENVADFVLGEPNNAVYVAGTAHKVPVAVTVKVPFHLEIVQPKVPLVRNGTMSLKVVVRRDEGFDKPVHLEFPFSPPGVGAAGAVDVPAGQGEGAYPLNANGDAMTGKWPIMVIGAADLDGQAWVSSQLAELEIAVAPVVADVKRAACEQGKSTQLFASLTHNSPFEGTAQIQLLGLPPGVSAAPVEFNKDTAEVAFDVKTTGETPVGSHKTLFCQATITQQGEPIVATIGTTELQVSAPPANAPPAAAPSEASQVAAALSAKPLSRLQKLRAQVLSAKGGTP